MAELVKAIGEFKAQFAEQASEGPQAKRSSDKRMRQLLDGWLATSNPKLAQP